MTTIALDLGCGGNPGNPFNADVLYGIDFNENKALNVVSADLSLESIPFGDNFFDFIVASHILEHIPRVIYLPHRRFAFVELMNEIWRVLKPNGTFLSITPAFPHPEAFQDPTHVNFITEKTFPEYFCGPNSYGFNGAFVIELQGWREFNLFTRMKKVYP